MAHMPIRARVSFVLVLVAASAGCSKSAKSMLPQSFDRPGFSFNYPASWNVDEKDEDYDPDHMFSIDASPGAFILFVIHDTVIDVGQALETNVREQEKNLSATTRSDFPRWGHYPGKGMIVRGRKLGLGMTVRVFVFNAAEKTFTVTEFVPDDEERDLASGFSSVAASFRVKERPINNK